MSFPRACMCGIIHTSSASTLATSSTGGLSQFEAPAGIRNTFVSMIDRGWYTSVSNWRVGSSFA